MGNYQGKAGVGSEVGEQQNQPPTAPTDSPARALLESIGLGIYVGAFEVSGYDSIEKLQCLTHWDLDRVHRHSHVPILPNHREKILGASHSLSMTLAKGDQHEDIVEDPGPSAVISADVSNNMALTKSSQHSSPAAAAHAGAHRSTAKPQATAQANSINTGNVFSNLKFMTLIGKDKTSSASHRNRQIRQQQEHGTANPPQLIPAEFPELQPDSPEKLSSKDQTTSRTAQRVTVDDIGNSKVLAKVPANSTVFRRLLPKHLSKQQQSQLQQGQNPKQPPSSAPSAPQLAAAAATTKAGELPAPAQSGCKDILGGAEADKTEVPTPDLETTDAAATAAPQQPSLPSAAADASASGLISGFTMGRLLLAKGHKRRSARNRQQQPVQGDAPTAAAATAAAAAAAKDGVLVKQVGLSPEDRARLPLNISISTAATDGDEGGVDDLDASHVKGPSENTAAAAATEKGKADDKVAAAAADTTDMPSPAVTSAALAAQVTKARGFLQSLKRVRSQDDKAGPVGQKQQRQQQQQQAGGTTVEPVNSTQIPPQAVATTAAAVGSSSVATAAILDSGTVSSDLPAADKAAVIDDIPCGTEIQPSLAEEAAATHPEAAAADTSRQSNTCYNNVTPTAGPLTAHKSTLNHNSLKNNLPRIRQQQQQQRKAPTAWSELSATVTQMAYAVTVPLSAQPLPQPAREDTVRPMGTWAKLPDKVDGLAYAATAPISSPRPLLPQSTADQRPATAAAAATTAGGGAAVGAWADLASEVSKMSYAATVLAAADSARSQQQQRGTRLSYAAVQARFADEQGELHLGQQQQQPATVRKSELHVPSLAKGAAAAAGASSSSRPAAMTPGARQMHEQLLMRLRIQPEADQYDHPARSAAAAAATAVEEEGTGVDECSMDAAVTAANRMDTHGGSSSSTTAVKPVGPLSRRVHVAYRSSAAAAAAAGGGVLSGVASLNSSRSSLVLPAGHHQSTGDVAVTDEASQRSLTSNTLAGQGSTMQVATGNTMHVELGSTVLARLGSTTAPSSTAGSVISEYSTSSRLGGSMGRSRAADVQNIVLRARQRAEARHRLPLPTSPSYKQQQQQSADSTASTAAAAAAGEAGLSREAHQVSYQLLPPQQQQQQQSVRPLFSQEEQPDADAAAKELLLLPGQCNLPVNESSSTSLAAPNTAAAAAAAATAARSIEGERAMRMLQDYRTITELDRSIKARVTQLKAPGRNSCKGGPIAHGSTSNSYDQTALHPTDPPASNAHVGQTENTYGAGNKQQQQQQQRSSADDTAQSSDAFCPGHEHYNEATDSPRVKVSVGLLGIREALDNSYDAGKPRAGATAAAAAAANGLGSAGYSSSSKKLSRRADVYYNPFISPVCSPEPIPEQHVFEQRADEYKDHDNPFLRESLVLETPATAAAAASGSDSKQRERQRWLGVTECLEEIDKDKGSPAAAAAAAAGRGEQRQPASNALTAGLSSRRVVTKAAGAAADRHAMPPGAALVGPDLAKAAAAARNVDERIKRILMTSRARTAAVKAAAAKEQQQQADVISGLAAADQGRVV